MLKAKELRNQGLDELEASLREARSELYSLKNAMKYSKKAEKPHKIREKKQDVAKLLTVIQEKKSARSE